MTPDQAQVLESLESNDQVDFHDDGSITVTLIEPVEFTGETISQITFKRGNGQMVEAMDSRQGEVRKNWALAAASSGLPDKVFRDMDGADALLCASAAGSFLFTPRKRTKSNSPSLPVRSVGTPTSS